MGTIGTKIVNLNVKSLIETLNKAYADEWLAVYQYWVGAKIAFGRARGFVAKELEEHAEEEMKHAQMLAERIVQLGGKPLLEPKDWYKYSNCGYELPDKPDTITLLKQNIKGEQCAITVYKKILDMVKGKDEVTADMILSILKDEVDHEDELESLLEDLK